LSELVLDQVRRSEAKVKTTKKMILFKQFLSTIFIFITTAAWTAVCFFKVYQSADPSGGDGYFYLKQMEWLGTHYSFYHRDYSFIFFPLTIIYKITNSSLLAFQLLTSFSLFSISTVLGLIFYTYSADWSKNKYWPLFLSCLFALLIGMQDSLLKLCYEFAKSGLAQALLLLGIYCSIQNHKRLSFLFLALAAITHKVVALFVLLYLVIYFIQNLSSKKKLLVFILGLSFSFILSLFIFPSLFNHIINFFNHIQLSGVFSLKQNQLISLSLTLLLFLWLMFGVFYIHYLKSPLFYCVLIFGFIPFLPFFSGYNSEIKNRLFLLSFTFAFVLFASLLSKIKNEKLRLISILLSLGFLFYNAAQKTHFPWIQAWSQEIQNLDQLTLYVSPTDELVTQHGLQFYIDYKTPIRARSMVSPERKPKFQIAYNPEFYHLNTKISDEIRQIQILSLGSNYSLFNFDEFQQLMRWYPILMHWRNQFQIRPDFIQDY